MKYLFFILPLLFLACGDTNTGQRNVTPSSSVNRTEVPSDGGLGMSREDAIALTQTPVTGGTAKIDVTIRGAQPGGLAQLIGIYGHDNFLQDTATISSDGTMSFVKNEGYAQGIYYLRLPSGELVQICLGEDQEFSMSCEAADIYGSMQVEGSTENDVFYQIINIENQYNPTIGELTQQLTQAEIGSDNYENLLAQQQKLEIEKNEQLEKFAVKHPDLLVTKFKRAGQNPRINNSLSKRDQVVQYRNELWNTVDLSDRRLLRTPVIKNKLDRYMGPMTEQNADAIIGSAKYLIDQTLTSPEMYKYIVNWITIRYEVGKVDVMDAEAVFVHMIQNYFTVERDFWDDPLTIKQGLQKRADEMSRSLIGQQAQEVVSTTPDGSSASLMALNGDYLIVYMFNPTCEHCAIQTPKLVSWLKKNDAMADVFAIAIDTNDDEWKAYIEKNGMRGFTNVFDSTNRSIYGKYYVDVTPEIYVINQERKIIGKNLKVDQIDIIINRDKENK